ncbi:MAG: metallophosphoesterase [Nitrospira sp.]
MHTGEKFRILHCSDLHQGRQFREELWKTFVDKAVSLQPHLVLITGDCVDTPWRSTLKTIKDKIDALEAALNATRSEPERCQIRITPGNHDVRLTGLIPVRPWVTIPLCLLLLSVPLLLLWSWDLMAVATIAWIISITAALFTGLHQACIGHFAHIFRDRIRTQPEQFSANHITVNLYHFDSASAPLWFAEGLIPSKDFLTAISPPVIHPPMDPQQPGDHTDPNPEALPPSLNYALAMTHHHAIGVPNDHANENLMIMRNSGTFLSELAAKKIRLVLHGHRHHPKFSRVSIHADKPEQFQIGILGAGTLMRGKTRPERYGYQFYALELDANLNMEVQSYLSTDGSDFLAQPAFFVEDLPEAIRRQRLFAHETFGLKAAALKASTTVFPDGDTVERIEYHHFQVTDQGKNYEALPMPACAEVDRGHIEGFRCSALSENCPPTIHLEPNLERYTLRSQQGTIQFGSSCYHSTSPFSFYTEFTALNSISMSVQQHQQRYGLSSQPRYEHTTMTTPVWPVDKLELTVYFPEAFTMDGWPELVIKNLYDQRLNLIEQEYRASLLFEPKLNMIRLSIPHPPPQTTFDIRWRLSDVPPPEARAIALVTGATLQLQRTYIQRTWNAERTQIPPSRQQAFLNVGELVEEVVRNKLKLTDDPPEPLEITLMIYDVETHYLRVVAGNYRADDPRASRSLEYGDGIAGRCLKSNSVRIFNKAEGLRSGKVLTYLPWSDFPQPSGIPHEVLLCIPLTHPDDTNLVYGVLNIGSERADSALLRCHAQEREPKEQTQARNDSYAEINLACWKLFQDDSRSLDKQ